MAGLEDLYREIILDHYRSPRNRGELAVPPAHRVEGFLEVNDGVLTDLRIAGQGCSISQSSASMMSAAVKGRPVEQARKLIRSFKAMMSIHEHSLGGEDSTEDPEDQSEADTLKPEDLGELAALQGVVKFPVRIKCATLSWNALAQGLDEIAAGVLPLDRT
jgi:nitrogen fixation NifU-like protein